MLFHLGGPVVAAAFHRVVAVPASPERCAVDGRDAADMAFIEAVAEAGRNIYGPGGVHCRDDAHDLGGGRPVEVGRAIGDEVIATDGHPLAIDRALECALLITVGTQGEVILAISPTRGDRGLVNSLTGGSDVFNGDRDGVVATRFTVPDLRDEIGRA